MTRSADPFPRTSSSAAAERAALMQAPDGVEIAYRVAGRHAGQPADRDADASWSAEDGAPPAPVLLLHGLASNLTRWSEFVEHTGLTRQRAVIRVDLRGHGDSPTRGAIGLERWADDLAALLDREGHARAVLVGHSLGAQVALHFAARHPSRTAAIALIDPVFHQALRGRWRRIARLGPVFRVVAATVRGLNALGLRRRTLRRLDLRELDRQARIALQSPEDEAAFVRQYSSTWADLRSFRTAHYLQELVEMFRPVPAPETITVPVLVVLSRGGTFADPAESRQLIDRFPQQHTVHIDCQHWPLTERPDEVRRAIEDWCAALRC